MAGLDGSYTHTQKDLEGIVPSTVLDGIKTLPPFAKKISVPPTVMESIGNTEGDPENALCDLEVASGLSALRFTAGHMALRALDGEDPREPGYSTEQSAGGPIGTMELSTRVVETLKGGPRPYTMPDETR